MKRTALFPVILAVGFATGWMSRQFIPAATSAEGGKAKAHWAVVAGVEDGLKKVQRDRIFLSFPGAHFTHQQRLCLLYQYAENMNGILKADVIRDYKIPGLRREISEEIAANLFAVLRSKGEVACEYREFENMMTAIPWGPGSVRISYRFHLSNNLQIGEELLERLAMADLREEHIGARKGEVRRYMAASVKPLVLELLRRALAGDLGAHVHLHQYLKILSARELGISKSKLHRLDEVWVRESERSRKAETKQSF